MEEAILFNHWSFQFEFPGESTPRHWKLERALPPMKAAYGKHLERLALAGIQRHRDTLDEFAYKTALREWTYSFLTQSLKWRSPLFWETLHDRDNLCELLFQWFQQSEVNIPMKKQLSAAQFRQMFESKIKVGEQEEEVSDVLYQMLVEMITEKNPTHPPALSAAMGNH